jgi:hypothetical protein
MSRLNIGDRVYGNGGEQPCMWFAMCRNPANGLRTGPIGGGKMGGVPICQRCDDKVERLAQQP